MKTKFSNILEDQKTPLVEILLRYIQEQAEEIALLKDEIAKLKGQKPRLKLKKSKTADDAKAKAKKKESKDSSRCTRSLKLLRKEQRIIQPENLPTSSIFKGYLELL